MLKKFSSSFYATFLVAFALVAVKKWEPGGNLDSLWYSAIGRNVAQTGDYHHFFISPTFYPTVADHMPLTYWITGFIISLLGPSDFVARLYPMFMGILSYLFVYGIGCMIGERAVSGETSDRATSSDIRERAARRGRHYGLAAVIAYVLAYGSSKWNGALMLDVPLTTYFLGAAYFLIRGLEKPKFYVWAAPFLVGAIMTKGPIVGGLPFALLAWIVWDGQWRILKSKPFWGAVTVSIAGLLVFCLPWFQLDGMNPFVYFYKAKQGYLATGSRSWIYHFAYLEVLWTNGAPLLLLFLYSSRAIFGRTVAQPLRSMIRLCFLVVICTVVPLSMFEVKFPHYMLPVYPFMALTCSWRIARWLERYRERVPVVLSRIAIFAVFLLAFLPIQTSGGRSKETLNLVNVLKFDPSINFGSNTHAPRRVLFMGTWNDDMAMFQSFKWWGNVNLETVTREELVKPEMSQNYVIVGVKNLPVSIAGRSRTEIDCLMINSLYCVIAPAGAQFKMPDEKFPHQVY